MRPFDPLIGSRGWDPPGEMRGINLRSWLVLQLADSGRSVTVAELVDQAQVSGLRVEGRASKSISDALRWEVLRGRVVRIGRGRYAIGRLARSTKHLMRQRLIACRARVRRSAAVHEQPGVRQAREIFASIRAVAPMMNRPITPHPDGTIQTANSPP